MKCLVNIVLLSLFTLTSAYSQYLTSGADSLAANNYFRTDFYNDLNTANMLSSLAYRKTVKKTNFSVYNSFNSSVTKFVENFSNDYNNLEVKTDYNLLPKFYTGAGIASKLVSTNQPIDLNKGYSNFYFTTFDFLPSEKVFINSKFGLKDEKQVGVYSKGFSGMVESYANNVNISDFISSAKVYLSLDKFSERTNYSYEINSKVDKMFSENASNSGLIKAFTVRTDFFTPATQSVVNSYNVNNNIQTRSEDYVMLSDNLDYSFNRHLKLKLIGMFFLKNINNGFKYKPVSSSIITENVYDNNIKENLLRTGFELEYKLNFLSTRFNVSYTERAEDHSPVNVDNLAVPQKEELERIEKDKNNNSKTSTAYMEVLLYASNTNTIKIQGASSLLRYDTDSELNYDDRDELLLNGMVSHRYYNFKNFFVETSFEYNSSILNYIFKEKSSNNNKNSVYKLNSYSVFRPAEGVATKNFFQVLANYTVYKYEDIVSQVQSFSFRQLYLADSTDINISKKFIFGIYGELKLYEQGQFNNEKFSVKPLAFYDERTLGSSLNYDIKNFIRLYVGFRHYIRRFYTYDKNEKVLKRTQSTYGPYAGLVMNIMNNSSIYVLGGIDKLEVSDNPDVSTSNNLVIKVLWNL